MVRQIKRWFAIRSYVMRLSGELGCRFGMQRFYTLDQITQAVKSSRLSPAFIAYAHATFCSRREFDRYYGSLRVNCTYDGLRSVVARRFLGGSTMFDGGSVVRAFRRPRYSEETNFYESGEGTIP